MEFKHQVFVSSTYKDLIEERQHVIHALLELDCIPAGMELFPATDEDAWSLIKEVIDSCDYYVLIISGKYGSVGPKGISYTEMEYDYAVETGKPIICFLHSQTDELPASKIEKKEDINIKLESFKDKVKSRHCKFYNSPEDLGGKVSRSLIQLRKKHPGEGWVRGKFAMTDKIKSEFDQMRAKIAELELELVKKMEIQEIDTSDLEQGEDTIKSVQKFNTKPSWSEPDNYEEVKVEFSWNEIIKYVGPALQGEGSEVDFKYKLRLLIYHKIHDVNPELYETIKHKNIGLPLVVFDKVKVQLQALGLIESGIKRRSVSDNETYWNLTRKGEKSLLNLQAKRKKDSEKEDSIEN
ncbi:hypothetical protein BTO15_18270 [Polaribacter sejongensis]|uniref:DUF4062 domain-containing protein n=1 Tax=Polaribacter sejongensis TaxID=985043 RepID=A0ABM6Q3Q2_9FLAO|nr:DUF4062 domain-containing protein [Polaribacter sejongensis]AUC23916.1 hypothetical protein BTO15_18270 [Polaribacter sejongensis]